MFELCSVFEVQKQLSLVFATIKDSEKKLGNFVSLVIYAPNFKHDFLSKKVCTIHGKIRYFDSNKNAENVLITFKFC